MDGLNAESFMQMSLRLGLLVTVVFDSSLGGDDLTRFCQKSDELWNIH